MNKIAPVFDLWFEQTAANVKPGHEGYSFLAGWIQVQQRHITEVKTKIMAIVGVTTRAGWANRLRGDVIPKVTEKEQIEAVFKEYGIERVWGIK